MPNETEDIVQYQWIKGDNQGTVETQVDTDGQFLVFESGRRCNQSVLGEFMMKIDMDNPVLQFEDPIQTVKSKPKAKAQPKKAETVTTVKEVITPLTKSPTIPLIQKAKKTKTKLNVRFEVELPSKSFIKVMEESFEEDIIQDLAEYIVSNIEDPKQFLIDNLKQSISEWNKYNNKTTKSETR